MTDSQMSFFWSHWTVRCKCNFTQFSAELIVSRFPDRSVTPVIYTLRYNRLKWWFSFTGDGRTIIPFKENKKWMNNARIGTNHSPDQYFVCSLPVFTLEDFLSMWVSLPPHQGGYVSHPCLFVCVCKQDNPKTPGRISTKLGGRRWYGSWRNSLNFVADHFDFVF